MSLARPSGGWGGDHLVEREFYFLFFTNIKFVQRISQFWKKKASYIYTQILKKKCIYILRLSLNNGEKPTKTVVARSLAPSLFTAGCDFTATDNGGVLQKRHFLRGSGELDTGEYNNIHSPGEDGARGEPTSSHRNNPPGNSDEAETNHC